MVPGQNDYLAEFAEPPEELSSLARSSFVVNQIADHNQMARSVVVDQSPKPLFDRGHAPKRDEAPGRPLAELKSEVRICHGQPALAPVEEAEPTVQHHMRRDQCLIRRQSGHQEQRELKTCPKCLPRLIGRLQMEHILRLTLILALGFLASCASQPGMTASKSAPGRLQKVRTTAYTHNEGGSGVHNAVGRRLANGNVKSAAADWSRFPLGTRFRVLSTGQEYIIDDYGGALVGTSTIDLYKDSRAAMRRWGVRHVDIEILHWGSTAESLKVLRPRSSVRIVRRMIAGLEARKT